MKLFGKKSISSILYIATGIFTVILTIVFLFFSTSLLLGNKVTNETNELSFEIPLMDTFFEGINTPSTFA